MSVESRAAALVTDGPVVVVAVPVGLAPQVSAVLRRVLDEARALGAPARAMRPLSDVVNVLDLAAFDASMSALERVDTSASGRAGENVVDADGGVPHCRPHAIELLSLAELAERVPQGAHELGRLARAGRLPGARQIGGRGGPWVVDWNMFKAAATRGTAMSPAEQR